MSTKSQVKICVDCKNEFEIDSGDLNLYEKVGLKIPEQCFFCRLKQYAAFWVFGKFRKGVSNLSGESLITVLPSTARYPIYKSHEWWGDAWNPIDFGQDYDPSKPFFEQLKELQEKIPHPHQVGKNNTNCDWCDDIWFSRNCYLTRAAFKCENLSYGYRVIGSKDSFDLTLSFNLQNSYDCLECHDSFNLSFSENSRDCIDSYFLYDCRNCQNYIKEFAWIVIKLNLRPHILRNAQKKYFAKVAITKKSTDLSLALSLSRRGESKGWGNYLTASKNAFFVSSSSLSVTRIMSSAVKPRSFFIFMKRFS